MRVPNPPLGGGDAAKSGPDSPPLELLRKVLVRERELGYSDRGVIGGLDRFLERWLGDVPGQEGARRQLPRPAGSYRAMAPAERAAFVDALLKHLAAPAPAAKAAAKGVARLASKLLGPGQSLDTALAEVKGFPADAAQKLARLGAASVRDLLYYFPRRHIDFSRTIPIAALKVGEDQTAIGTVWESGALQLGRNPRNRAAEAIIGDESGNIRAVWFNQPWMVNTLKRGMRVALSGRVSEFRGRKVFENPEHEAAGESELVHTARLVPVYPLTAGFTARRARALIKKVVDGAAPLLGEFLPEAVRQHRGLLPLAEAIREAHFPATEASKDQARLRLAFDELLLLQLGVLWRKKAWKEQMPGHPLRPDAEVVRGFVAGLPFALTGAQRRVMDEVLADLRKPAAMSRIVQGEVGSGKTVIALAAVLAAVGSGHQAAFMAPTEILAEQHFRTVQKLLDALPHPLRGDGTFAVYLGAHRAPVSFALLTGSTPRKRKEEVQRMAAEGLVDVLIGTHALFQKDVQFANLGLAIVDEQHRFGVMQRTELRQKGHNPHLLVMTATPIPRSLALTLYGDLDISVIGELPPGRQEIRTRWLDAGRRDSAYRFIQREVEAGRQAFIIYPLVEESGKLEVASAVEEHARLSRDVFPQFQLGLLHGRMKPAQKDAVMRAFRDGALQVLVSTAVVEVGIDVPNATVMMVDWADRFGLAQLHQFRGRVGRGEHQSYCMLVSHEPSDVASERLAILERVHDGFALAEEDLRLRGAGEFFGTRQSGVPDLRMARISDAGLLELARREAAALFQADPELASPEHRALALEVARAWAHRTLVAGEA